MTWRPPRAIWPFVVVSAFCLWLTEWLYRAVDYAFVGGTTRYAIGRMARHGELGRSLRRLELPTHASTYDYPTPAVWAEASDYNLIDWLLVSPTAAFMDFAPSWGAAQAAWVVMLALSTAWLARVVGCRGPGVVVAGCLAATSWPFWHNILTARGNMLIVSAGLVAIGAAILTARSTSQMLKQRRWSRWPSTAKWLLLLAVSGGLLLAVYPPLAVLLFLPGAVWLIPTLIRGSILGTIPVVVGLVAGVALASPALSVIWETVSTTVQSVGVENLLCPTAEFAVPSAFAALLQPPAVGAGPSLLTFSGAAIGSWALALGAPLARQRRLAMSSLLVLAGLMAWLSLGPCHALPQDQLAGKLIADYVPASAAQFWLKVMPIRDLGRLLVVALAICAVLSGSAVHHLWQRPRWAYRILAISLGVIAVGHSTWIIRSELAHPANWAPAPPPVTAQYLNETAGEPSAELPFDEVIQHLSVLHSPVSKRVNPMWPRGLSALEILEDPLARADFLKAPSASIRWLRQLGIGLIPAISPTAKEVYDTGLRWIFFDRKRCMLSDVEGLDGTCPHDTPAALTAVLGPPKILEEGVLLWDVNAAWQWQEQNR